MNNETKPNGRGLFWLTAALVLFLFASAFALSYDALYHLALGNGISQRLAWLWPLGLDAFMAASSLAVLWASLNQVRVLWVRALVFSAVAASVVGNMLHAPVGVVAHSVAALPPVVAFLAFEVLMLMVRHETTRAGLRSHLDALRSQLDQLTEQVDQADAELGTLRERQRSARDRTKALKDQADELQQAITDMEAHGGDTVNARRERLRTILSENGREWTQQELADELGVSRTTIKRDLKAIGYE